MDKKNAYIFPFLWMRGEEEDIIRTEIGKICECGIDAVCVEARPHDDFCGPKWWHDMDIVLDEATSTFPRATQMVSSRSIPSGKSSISPVRPPMSSGRRGSSR